MITIKKSQFGEKNVIARPDDTRIISVNGILFRLKNDILGLPSRVQLLGPKMGGAEF